MNTAAQIIKESRAIEREKVVRAHARKWRARVRLTLFLLMFDWIAAARGAYVVGWRVLSGERRTEREKEDRWKVSSVQGRGSSTLVAPPHRRKPNKPALKTTQITRIGDRTLQRNRTVIRFRTVRLDWIRLVAPLHLPRGRRNNPIAIIWSTSQRRCCPPCGWGTCACRAMARKTVSRKRKAEEPKEQQVNNKSLYT